MICLFNIPSIAVPAILGQQGVKIKDIQLHSKCKVVITHSVDGPLSEVGPEK